MPQLLVLAIAGAGLVAGYSWLSKKLAEIADAERASAAERQAAESAQRPKEMGHLEWDGEAGVYRPTRR